jgi:hypothetical protein
MRVLERKVALAYIPPGRFHTRSRIAAQRVANHQKMGWLTMTDIPSTGPTLGAWHKRSASRLGRWLFARMVCRRAPYFATIRPRFVELPPTW